MATEEVFGLQERTTRRARSARGARRYLSWLLILATLTISVLGSTYVTWIAVVTPMYALPVALFFVTPALWVSGSLAIFALGRFRVVLPYLLVSGGALCALAIIQIAAASLVDLATLPALVAFNGLALIGALEFLRN